MEADLSDKLEVARVLIERIDGPGSKARLSSMEAADRVLGDWANSAPASGQEQCDFEIVFEDGFSCRGHYYLKKTQRRISLSRYVRKNLSALAEGNVRRSAKRKNDTDIVLPGKDVSEAAQIALSHYKI